MQTQDNVLLSWARHKSCGYTLAEVRFGNMLTKCCRKDLILRYKNPGKNGCDYYRISSKKRSYTTVGLYHIVRLSDSIVGLYVSPILCYKSQYLRQLGTDRVPWEDCSPSESALRSLWVSGRTIDNLWFCFLITRVSSWYSGKLAAGPQCVQPLLPYTC
jgi:hypothetical protein